jgi:hypothetical protein
VIRWAGRAVAAWAKPRADLIVENLCLRQQLIVLQHRAPRPRLRCRLDFADPQGLDVAREQDAVDRIAVAQQVARGRLPGERLHELLDRPLGRGSGGHVAMDHALSVFSSMGPRLFRSMGPRPGGRSSTTMSEISSPSTSSRFPP